MEIIRKRKWGIVSLAVDAIYNPNTPCKGYYKGKILEAYIYDSANNILTNLISGNKFSPLVTNCYIYPFHGRI